jgi:hypothetical protein
MDIVLNFVPKEGVVRHKDQIAKFVITLSVIFLLAFIAVVPAPAQESSASITGTVVDPGGSPVKDATVTATDTERGNSLVAETNDSGAFNFSRVPVGTYDVKVAAKGFQSQVTPKLTLVLNQVARLDFRLKVGQVTESVEVSAATPLLQTDTTIVGSIVDSKTATDLPLSTHNTNQLTLISGPGVITPNLFGFQAAQNSFGTGRPYVNGAREQENNFILDGMDNNQADNNDVGYVPAPEAVQEFNLLTSNAPADFGNYLGGVVNVTIKSGTNSYHGDLYTYMRRGGWNANSWSNNLDGLPRPGMHYDNFGATVGGPIVKNKLFFFTDFAGSRWSQPSTSNPFNTISAAMRGGDFSALCTAGFNGAGICANPALQLFDPASSATSAGRTAFAFNRIPAGRISNAAKAIVNSQFYPTAQVTTNVQQFTTNSYQGDAKIDWIPSDRDHLMGRWSQQGVEAPTTNSIPFLGNADKTFPLKNFVIDETHTFTPNLVNDARIGFSYFPVTEGFSNPTGQNLGQAFGIAGVNDTFLPSINFINAGISVPGVVLPNSFGNNDLVQSFHDTTLQFEDTFTYTHGKHVIHAGFEVYRYIMNDLYPGNAGLAGQFNFTGQFTGNFGAVGTPSLGYSVADFLLGLPQDIQQGNGGGGNRYLRNSLIAGFGQDNWRITNNLTLNLGLRYELNTPRNEVNDRTVNFDIFSGQAQIGGQNGVPRATYDSYTGIANFEPRIGIAWSPDFLPNTVFRAAYGASSFMEANGVNNLPYQNPPFIQAHEVSFIPSVALPSSTLDQGFSNFPAAGCTLAALQALSPLCIQGATLHLTNHNLRPAVDQQWNLSIQHQFGSHASVQIGYVGNKIDHMSNIFIFNQKQLNPSGGAPLPGPFAQSLINCCGPNAPTVRFNDSSAIQRYNALQTTFEERSFHGLDFKANYTWSKCLNNSLGYFGPFGDEEALPGTTSQTGFSFFYQDAYHPKRDYGLCIADAAGLFNGYLVYEMPFGRGKMFGGNASDVVNRIIGGWTIATNFTLHTGFAITPLGGDSSGTGSASPRANCPLGVSQDGSGAIIVTSTDPVTGKKTFGKQWWNPLSATPGTPGQFGNCGIGSFRGPGLATADLNIGKRFGITERVNVEFLAQFINVTNTPILGRPSFFQGAGFGVIDSSNPGRQIQLGAKLHF